MPKRAVRPIKLPGSQFEPDTVHTIQLPELLSLLRARASGLMFSVADVSRDWNGNMGWFESLDAAEYGRWNAPSVESLALPDARGESDDTHYFYDVTGNSLDVAAFVAGEPEYWQNEYSVPKPAGRILRFGIEIGGSSFVQANELRNRGEAIIALINSLELQGYSVELTVIRSYETVPGDKNYKFLIPIKNAGQALDVKRLQFIIGHPAFYRRCLFGLSEIANGETFATRKTRTTHYEPEGYIYIPFDAGLCETREESLQWAQGFALTVTAQNRISNAWSRNRITTSAKL